MCRSHTSLVIVFLVLALALVTPGLSVAAPQDGAAPVRLAQTTVSFYAADDAYVRSDTGRGINSNFLRVDAIFPLNDPTDTIERTYLKFDLFSLPPGAVVQSATLYLQVYDAGTTNGTQEDLYVHATGSSWAEDTIDWANQPGPGGLLYIRTSPIAPDELAAFPLPATHFSGPGMYSFVLKYPVENGAHSDGIDFKSKEAGASPRLDITYVMSASGSGAISPNTGPGPDMIPIPDYAVVGALLRSTPVYYAPDPAAVGTVELEVPMTLWVFGLDQSGQFYLTMLAGRKFWLPVEVLGPNYDDVWHGRPLPTTVVSG